MDLVKVFLDLLEAENLKSKDLANEHPALMPADVAAVDSKMLAVLVPGPRERPWGPPGAGFGG
jgi:hypothetical protein